MLLHARAATHEDRYIRYHLQPRGVARYYCALEILRVTTYSATRYYVCDYMLHHLLLCVAIACSATCYHVWAYAGPAVARLVSCDVSLLVCERCYVVQIDMTRDWMAILQTRESTCAVLPPGTALWALIC